MPKKLSDISFARAPTAKEFFRKEMEKRFDNLQPWQKDLVNKLVETGSFEIAAESSGLADKHKELVKKAQEKSIIQALQEAGFTDVAAAGLILEGLHANTVSFSKNGEKREKPDWRTRRDYMAIYLSLRKELAAKQGPKKDSIEELFQDVE